MNRRLQPKALFKIIEGLLRDGSPVEIDGLEFKYDADNRMVFESSTRPRVFLAYGEEDRTAVRKLYRALHREGFEPWMDCEKLLAGQNWPRAIERAIDLSEFFVGCFSSHSVAKRGHFQSELQYALNVAMRVPEEDIFLIPVRLDDCTVPAGIARKTQWVNLFPEWSPGVADLIKAMRFQTGRRKRRGD